MNPPITPPPPGTAVSRLKDRLLPWSRSKDESSSSLPAVVPPRPPGLPSSIAEFLLVFRLRVQRRSALSGGVLERALRMVVVTCKNWFSATDSRQPHSRKHDLPGGR